MYFLFVGHYTQWLIWPGIIGLILQIVAACTYDSYKEAFNAPYMGIYSCFIVIWGAYMLQYWKRLEKRTALEWGTNDFEDNETDRADFKGTRMNSHVNGLPILFFPEDKRASYIHQSYLVVFLLVRVVCCMFGGLFLHTVMSLSCPISFGPLDSPDLLLSYYIYSMIIAQHHHTNNNIYIYIY